MGSRETHNSERIPLLSEWCPPPAYVWPGFPR